MYFLSTLALSLLSTSNAASLPQRSLDTDVHLQARSVTPDNSSVLGPVGQLHITNGFVAPDGVNRSATLVNGVFPAPLIKAKKNDKFSLEVLNELTDDTMALETSIHYHGIFQRKSNWADGSSYVTQCPVSQQETFVQKFETTGQTGTYWYHSQYASQYCDGLRGPLVIYDPEDPHAHLYDVDDENTIITLADWWHVPDALDEPSFTFPNSTLINGKGRYPNGPSSPLSVVNVQQGLRYRFRVIAMSCDAAFNFTIDGHRMTIIEVDGNEVEPVDVDSIPLLPGQRYSVVVTANKPVGNYWIRGFSLEPNTTFEGGQNLAILRYSGAPDEDPTSSAGPYELSFDETNLHALSHPGAPGIPEIGKADVSLVLAPGFTPGHPHGKFSFGNVTYANPGVPVLLQILNGAVHPSQLLPEGSVYTFPPNKVIEVSFPHPEAAPGAPHPIHLHGHAFEVVRSAGSNSTNFINPVRRDVVSSGASSTDNVTIRFKTDNAGPWLLRDHLDWMFNHGFAVVMAEAPNKTVQQESKVIPKDWTQLCKKTGN